MKKKTRFDNKATILNSVGKRLKNIDSHHHIEY